MGKRMTITVEFGKNRYHEQSAMIEWCRENFGAHRNDWMYSQPEDWEGLGDWGVSSVFGITFFYFRHKKDAEWFILRWT